MKANKYWIFGAVLIVVSILSISGCRQNMLTKQQIIDIANRQAVSDGLQLDEYEVYYDVGNVKSKDKLATIRERGTGFAKRFKALDRQDYQAVFYKFRGLHVRGGGYTVFVDRKTGEVITVLREK